jgi:hypothetical protein
MFVVLMNPSFSEHNDMQYLCLIYSDGTHQQSMDEAAQQAYMGAYFSFTKAIQESGNFLAGEALHGVDTATSVRVRDGKVVSTDGPFAETKEFLGGFYMITAADLDEAIEIASRIPTATYGTIEVRPVMKFS